MAAPAGSYVSTTGADSATLCPVGTYQDQIGQSACKPAPVGTYVNTTGAAAANLCPVGTYQDQTGQTFCVAAPQGKYVDQLGAVQATPCAAGTYQPDSGQSSCIAAPVNTFVDTTGAIAATPCPAGTYQPMTGQTSCIELTALAISITSPAIGTVVPAPYNAMLSAPFTDDGNTGSHTCSIDWGDESSTTVGATVPNLCSATHSFATAGVYIVDVTVTNEGGLSDSASVMVVVYDPSAGFVTGGGWIDSPAGAYVADPTMTGKATFGFVAKYKKGQSVPDGNTEFQFKAGNLNFHSTSYQWLVVNQGGNNAQFKGTGTINGSGSYDFMIWATQGSKGSPDTFRIQIIDNSTGQKIYDNGVGQSIGGGSIVIHK